MQDKQCVHCFVSGKVHGVWFRAGTQQEALALGVTGWVRNVPDGRVEAMICGAEDRVEQMLAWLHVGPEHAKVDRVDCQKVAYCAFERFAIL